MNTVFPENPGLNGVFLLGWRRRPGSGVSADNIEQVFSVIVKQTYTVVASDSDPALGSLTPRDAGPEIFESDFPGNFLRNAEFGDGAAHWSTSGGASADFIDSGVELDRSGAGDLRQTAVFGRQLRDRGFGVAIMAEAEAGLALPRPSLVASGTTLAQSSAGLFPGVGSQPLDLAAYGRAGAAVTATSLSVRYPTLDVDDSPVRYTQAAVTTVEYESDLVPYKPESDLIVIADAPPLPIDISVNGSLRYSQEFVLPQELTGLGWEERMDTPRQAEGGDFLSMTQALPDDFNNSYYNGYRRNRRQGGAVPFLNPGDEVSLTRGGGTLYGFTLPAEAPKLRHAWFTGSGQDDPCVWKHRDVAMHMDTLVVEPDRNHGYAVWRGCWSVDEDPGGGPIPFANNREALVTMQGEA